MRKSSGSSSSRMCLLARRPWRRRLRLDGALPAAVRGPVDFFAFSRLALIWASVGVRGSFVFSMCVLAGAGGPVLTLRLGEGWGGGGGRFAQVVENRVAGTFCNL